MRTTCYGCSVDPDALAEANAWAWLLASQAGVVAAGVFGALWGSFYNVCIARIPRGLSVIRPGSHCFACQAPVRPLDNIPILSYFVLRGRCRSCGVRFSPRYAAVEALTAGLSALLYWQFVVADAASPPALRLARYALAFAFTSVLLVLSFIDLDTKRLPDIITLPAIPVFFLAGFGTGDVSWLDRLIGGAAGYLAVRIISDGYYYITGREGLGLGDGKLLAVIGVVLGWRALPVVVFSASFIGVLVSVPILLVQRRRQGQADPVPESSPAAQTPAAAAPTPESDVPVASIRRAEVPFGPFLALSGFVYLLVGPRIWEWFAGRLAGG
jgi:leader peptidase (prepilin peptidase)/N-methyltransferase